MRSMPADGFAAVLDYLGLDDAAAGQAFGITASDVAAMKAGTWPVPFLISALAVLMCESEKATQLALQHGLAMRENELTFADLVASAAGVGFVLKAKRDAPKPKLRIVQDDEV